MKRQFSATTATRFPAYFVGLGLVASFLAGCAGPSEYFVLQPAKDGATGSMRATAKEGKGFVLDAKNTNAQSRGGAIEASAMLRGINFTSLMRDLGVHPHSYVAWDIKDISLPKLRGTFVPLKLDADFVAHTTGFAIYDHPATDPARARLFGLGTADITAHLAVRPNAVEFQRANVRVGGASHVEGAFVSLGFDEQIRAEVPHAHVDLADITPVGAVHMGGKADLEFHMGGKFSHPTPEGEIRNFEDFSVADLRFGNL